MLDQAGRLISSAAGIFFIEPRSLEDEEAEELLTQACLEVEPALQSFLLSEELGYQPELSAKHTFEIITGDARHAAPKDQQPRRRRGEAWMAFFAGAVLMAYLAFCAITALEKPKDPKKIKATELPIHNPGR